MVLSSGSNHRYAVTELHKTPDVLRGPGDLSYTLSPSNFIISGNRNILFSHEANMLTHLFHSLKKWQQLQCVSVRKLQANKLPLTPESVCLHTACGEKQSLTCRSIVRLSSEVFSRIVALKKDSCERNTERERHTQRMRQRGERMFIIDGLELLSTCKMTTRNCWKFCHCFVTYYLLYAPLFILFPCLLDSQHSLSLE